MTNAVGHVLNVPLVDPRLAQAAGTDFSSLREAVRRAGELIQQEWLRLASGELVNRLTGAYIAGLRQPESVEYPFDGDMFAIGVYNLARHAAAIEYGHPAFNLAERIRWGQTPKSRWSKSTRRWYIIAPFRHYTPPRAAEGATPGRTARSMPRAIHELAKSLDFGQRLTFDAGRLSRGRWAAAVRSKSGRVVAMSGAGAGGARLLSPTTPGAQAYAAPRRRSDRSYAAHLDAAWAGQAPAPATHHQSSIYEGLTKTGSPGHVQYMTWRVITQQSQWWIPAQPGAYVARQVATRTGPIVRGMLEEAFTRDVERAIGAALTGGSV